MKVLQINSVCGIRSTGRICTDIADVLTDEGHECKIAYGRESVPENYRKYAVRIGTELDVNFHVLISRIFDKSGFGSRKATEKFIDWVKDYNPDIIHLHNIHGYYINIEVLFEYLKSCDKKIIWTLHDCWAFTGHCAYFDFAGCNLWKNGNCGKCPQKNKYPASLLFDNSENNYFLKKKLFTETENITLITPSRWLAEITEESYLGKHKIKVIPNGISTDNFKSTPSDIRKLYNIADKKIVLGVAGAWDTRKGMNDIVRLSAMLDDNYQIVMIGLSDKQIKSLPANIIAITRTNDTTELAQWYTAANVFINPTYEDNYPTTNLEAQACGTPVITYRTGGSVESVPADNIVDKGNIDGLYEKILREDLKVEMLDFSKTAMLNAYKEIYLSAAYS